MARRSELSLEFTPNYGGIGEASCCSMRIRYGGVMKHTPRREYVGGSVEMFDFVEIDKISMTDLHNYASELGYPDAASIRFWLKINANLDKCKCIETDNDVSGIRKYVDKKWEVEVIIEHLSLGENAGGRSEGMLINESVIIDEGGIHSDGGEDENQSGDDGDRSSDDDSMFYESEYDMSDDDTLFDKYVDPVVDKGKYVEEAVIDEDENNCVLSDDDFASLHGSDDEEVGKKYPKFNPKTDSKNPELILGMIFSSKKEAKFAIESHCFRRGMMIRFEKNDKLRLRAVCKKNGCGWFILVSKIQNDSSWQVRSYNSTHCKCSWNYNNSSIKSGWLGKTFVKKFKDNPKLGTTEFRKEVCTSLMASVSRSQAYRAKRKALNLIEGKLEEQFNQVRDYCNEIERTNPGSTIVMKLSEENRFQRFYMCFNACKVGFKNGCRPVIGVDGCWLKGNFGGQLLSAVGLDANNNIFPLAHAIVESETKDTWMWFLSLLDRDIGFQNQEQWTFMSDKQKGLIPAFETLFPNANNRFCVRHLHSNMKRDGFTGLSIKSALWAAARATRVEEFERRMQELREIDENAFQWLANKDPHNWSRAYFNSYPRCDILLNNMCECFNSFILDARSKPIISLLENIRNLLMTRMQMNRDKAAKWDGPLCPKIKQKLMKIMKEAGECIPMKSDEWNFQIIGPYQDQYTVNVLDRTCSCKKWDLSGIPCKHACSAIWCRLEEPEAYVHKCYSVDSYLKSYENPIFGTNGSELWPKSNLPPPLKPMYTEKVGRPQKMRRRESDEPPAATSNPFRLRGVKRTIKCKTCGGLNHNSKTCRKRARGLVDEVESTGDQQENVFQQAFSQVVSDYLPTQASVSSARAPNQPPSQAHPSPAPNQPPSQAHPSPALSQTASQAPRGPTLSQVPSQAPPGSAPTPAQKAKINKKPKEKLQVRKSKNKVQIKGGTNTIGSFQLNKSSPIVTAPMIVKGGMNFITVSNLRSSIANSSNPSSSKSNSDFMSSSKK